MSKTDELRDAYDALERQRQQILDLEWQVQHLRALLHGKSVAERLFACNVDESAGLAEVYELNTSGHSVKA
jgi:hypothetical protein